MRKQAVGWQQGASVTICDLLLLTDDDLHYIYLFYGFCGVFYEFSALLSGSFVIQTAHFWEKFITGTFYRWQMISNGFIIVMTSIIEGHDGIILLLTCDTEKCWMNYKYWVIKIATASRICSKIAIIQMLISLSKAMFRPTALLL